MNVEDFTMVYDKILDSSIAADYESRHFFEDMLKLADWRTGCVDMTPDAIQRRLNMPIEKVKEGLDKLMQEDPMSNSLEEGGRRLVPISPTKKWGWRIVNYMRYKNGRSKEHRRGWMRDYMRDYRQKDGAEPAVEGQNGQVSQPVSASHSESRPSRDMSHFVPPTVEEVQMQMAKVGFEVGDCRGKAEQFIAHYAARGWKYKGGVKMVSWQHAVTTWKKYDEERNGSSAPAQPGPTGETFEEQKKRMIREAQQ
jgi:hypothetical protein